MSTELAKKPTNTISALLSNAKTKDRLEEILGKRSSTFATSILQIVNSNASLQKCEPQSVLNAALVATTLDLPINNQLGLAYIVPYGNQATIQLGYRAYIQLAQRSGQFKTINVSVVKEGEVKKNDRLTGEISFEWNDTDQREKLPIAGFVAYFELLNGYSHTFYMTKKEVDEHALKYSQTFKKYKTGLWKDEYEGMGKKTVLKMLLSKYAPLSIEMSRAAIVDQGVVKDFDGQETIDVDYVDNGQQKPMDQEQKELIQFQQTLDVILSLEELQDLEDDNTFSEAETELINKKRKSLTAKK